MKIKISIVLLLFLAFFGLSDINGQESRDARSTLAGKWRLEQDTAAFGDFQLAIEQSDNTVRIRSSFMKGTVPNPGTETIYYIGTGDEKNAPQPSAAETKSIWKKNKLVTSSVSKVHVGPAFVNITTEETWALSAHGTVLTWTQKTFNPGDIMETPRFPDRGPTPRRPNTVVLKQVYRRIE